MSKHRNQTVIIPPDQVTTDEALVIEIPRALRNKPVVIAQARTDVQVQNCCKATDYSMFLNTLQSSKSAPGIMAAGNYVHSSTQYGGSSSQYGGGLLSFRPQPAAQHSYPHSHPGPIHSQTIEVPDKQWDNRTENSFIQTPNKATSAMTTSTDRFDNLNKTLVESDNKDEYDISKNKAKKKQQEVQNAGPSTSDKFFENLVKAIWTNPAADDCKSHCLKCCEREQQTDPSPPRSYVPETTFMDDYDKFCPIERSEPPPSPPRPSRMPCKPSVPATPPLEHCKIHCSKCCELASGNKAPSGGHFKCIPSSTHCPPKDNSEATSEDEDQSYCCSNHKEKEIVQLYECDSCWSKYSTKTDPCSCSEWEENQRPQGDFEFGEPLPKTCEISCNSQIAEINERLDRICAKIEFYEKYFDQADNQEDTQEICSEYCENQSESIKVTERCEPTCEYRGQSDKPTVKIEANNFKVGEPSGRSLPRANPEKSKEGEEISKSTRLSMESFSKEKSKPQQTKESEKKSDTMSLSADLGSKEKAETDLCQYCCSRSSLKSIPSTCVQQCKAKLEKSEEQIRKDTVRAEALQKHPEEVLKTPNNPPPQIKPATQQPGTERMRALSMPESKYKKSCKFDDENEIRGDVSSKKASEVSACCKCGSKSQTNVLKPIIKIESREREGSYISQEPDHQPTQQDAVNQRRILQSSLKCRSPPSQSSKICIKCCEESQKKPMSQSQVSDGICHKCPSKQIEKSPSAPTNSGDICAKCCKPLFQEKPEVNKDLFRICYVCEDTNKTSREEMRVELQAMCRRCCSESEGQKQTKPEPSCSCKDSSKDSEPQESPPAQRSKCTKCNKEYITETARKIGSDFKEGICNTCCLETILSRLTLRAEPDDGTTPDTSEELPDKERPSTSETEGMKVDSSSRLENETSETDRGGNKTEDKEQQSDLEKEEPKKKRTCFLLRKKSAKRTENDDNSNEKEK